MARETERSTTQRAVGRVQIAPRLGLYSPSKAGKIESLEMRPMRYIVAPLEGKMIERVRSFRGGLGLRACLAVLMLALCVGCGPRLLKLSFQPVDVQAAKPKPPPPPPPKPVRVKVMAKMIQITERVEFETDSSTILSASHSLLDEVVKALKEHPEIQLVEVQGHTDSTGKAAHNMKLSRARAKSVQTYLTEKGIDAKRLKSKGYGLTKPIADNDTDEGKQKNRRVEFHILKRAPKDEK